MQKAINIFDSIFGTQEDCIYRLHIDEACSMLTIKFARYNAKKRIELINIMCSEYIPFLEHNGVITCLVRVH